MKLRRLSIDRLPGIDEPFALKDLGDGFNVIVGPNGIGKSSLCRAARSLLWAEQASDTYIAASALFDREGQQWKVQREGSRHGWQRDGKDEPAPPLPASHLDGCFFLMLRELLDASRDAGLDLAAQIRRQMSGGFDLDRAAKTAFGSVGPRHGRKEQGALDKAEQELRRASAGQVRLSRREQLLEGLDQQRTDAESAQRRLGHFDRALELDKLRDERTRVDAELSDLPGALSKLTGDELTQLDQRAKELDEKRGQRSQKETEIEGAQQATAESRLENLLDAADLSTWLARARKLAQHEASLEPAMQELHKSRRAVGEASRAVGAADETVPTIDLSSAEDLFKFLREATDADHERDAITRRLALLEGRGFSQDDRERLERLRPAAGALRAWLRARDPEAGSPISKGRSRSIFLAVIGALVVGGIGLALLAHPGLALLAGAGMGLAITLWLVRPDPSVGYAREAAQRDFPTGIDPPNAWTVGAASERLREVEGRIGELEAAEQRARDRGVERADLDNELKAVTARRGERKHERQELASRLGLEHIPQDAELVDMARALDQLRQAHQAASGADARVKEIHSQHAALLEDLAAVLTAHGEAKPTDAASAGAGIDQLTARNSALHGAKAAESNARDTIKDRDEEITGIEAIVTTIYERAEVESGDRVTLTRRIDSLGGYHELRSKRDALDRNIQLAVGSLSRAGEQALTQTTREDLQDEKHRLEDRAERLNALLDELAEIRAEVKQAREGHSLEETIARRESAVRSLEECRGEALRAAAGRFLLEAVQGEHETQQMPRVLDRARELFAAFTHHAYELRVAPDNDGSFIAIETRSGNSRRPHELSDGTRTQLLLAARLAFANEAERENPLPLFLDEALDQSDPVRFQAIVKSLGMMVKEEDRQVFYLTNDPMDVERIQVALREAGCSSARILDLGAIRRRVESISEPNALRVDPLPPIPAPDGATSEEYAVLLEVPPLDPRRGFAGQHLLYLLWEDMDLLHRLLASRIEHIGKWLLLSRNKAALAQRIIGAGGSGAQLDARAHLLEAFCQAWSEGRGRPIDRSAIERGGISDRYLDDVTQIANELGGNAAKLIDALRTRKDPRLQKFRTKATSDLEAFLTEEGVLDARPVLGESDIQVQLLATPAASRLPEDVVAELSHRWWSLCGGSAATTP